MTLKSDRKISNVRVIAGLMREALFNASNVSIDGDSGYAIQEILEHSRRDLKDSRLLVLTPVRTQSAAGEVLNVKIHFPTFVVDFVATVNGTESTRFELTFPVQVNLVNRRREHRSQLKFLERNQCEILVRCEGDHFVGTFQIADISSAGFGGILSVDEQLVVKSGSMFSGVLATKYGRIRLDGVLSEVASLSKRNQVASYKVGAQRIPEQATSDGKERRKEIRVKSTRQVHLEFISVINPNQPFSIVIDDLSVSGFGGVIDDPMFAQYGIEGLEIQLVDVDLTALVNRCENGRIHCVWVDGSEEGRLFWLKQVSTRYGDNISTATSDASDLFNIFCESGSLGSDFLRANRTYSREILEGLESESGSSSYIHRWVDRSIDGTIRGQISALKFGNNSWILGDLVGGSAEDKRIDSMFVSKFAYSFRQFCRMAVPSPRVLCFWLAEHPYWKQLNGHFLSCLPDMGFRGLMGYTRTVASTFSSFDDVNCSFWKVSADAYAQIESISSELGELLPFAQAMDFAIDRFSSPDLRRAVRREGQPFSRCYYVFEYNALKFLCVFTNYPLGANPNRVVDSAWVFPLRDGDPTPEEWSVIVSAIKWRGLLEGVSVPSVRRIFRPGQEQLRAEEAVLDCYLMHSAALEFFEEFMK